MNTRLDVPELIEKIRASPFNKSAYGVDIGLSSMLKSLSLYTHGEEQIEVKGRFEDFYLNDAPERLFECVPAFQRDNDKWSVAMQVSFVENILMGYKATLMFYEVVPNDKMPLYARCKVLDGLQRLTALYLFVTNQLKAFGYSYLELQENRILRINLMTLKLQIYSFNSEHEAVDFYISMNENITHAPEDIAKARKYLEYLNTPKSCALTI